MKCKHDYQIVEYGTHNCITQCTKCGKQSTLLGNFDPGKTFALLMLVGIVIGIILGLLDGLIFHWTK